MTTVLMRGAFHGTDDRTTAWCGQPLPTTAPEWTEALAEYPTCGSCKARGDADALAEAVGWIETMPDTRALAGPCGHLLATGHGDHDAALWSLIQAGIVPGARIVKPTPEQLLGFVEEARCEHCAITRPQAAE